MGKNHIYQNIPLSPRFQSNPGYINVFCLSDFIYWREWALFIYKVSKYTIIYKANADVDEDYPFPSLP